MFMKYQTEQCFYSFWLRNLCKLVRSIAVFQALFGSEENAMGQWPRTHHYANTFAEWCSFQECLPNGNHTKLERVLSRTIYKSQCYRLAKEFSQNISLSHMISENEAKCVVNVVNRCDLLSVVSDVNAGSNKLLPSRWVTSEQLKIWRRHLRQHCQDLMCMSQAPSPNRWSPSCFSLMPIEKTTNACQCSLQVCSAPKRKSTKPPTVGLLEKVRLRSIAAVICHWKKVDIWNYLLQNRSPVFNDKWIGGRSGGYKLNLNDGCKIRIFSKWPLNIGIVMTRRQLLRPLVRWPWDWRSVEALAGWHSELSLRKWPNTKHNRIQNNPGSHGSKKTTLGLNSFIIPSDCTLHFNIRSYVDTEFVVGLIEDDGAPYCLFSKIKLRLIERNLSKQNLKSSQWL